MDAQNNETRTVGAVPGLKSNVNRPNPSNSETGWTQFVCSDARTARRYRQVDHLRSCGNRCVLEALIAVERGESVASVLADFERLTPELYQATLHEHHAFAIGGVA